MISALFLLFLSEAPIEDVEGPIFISTPTISRYDYFEFAPESGAGLGSECACSSVTGAKGEALTLSSVAAYCTKGNTLSQIRNGDMVICPANTPRIMPGGDGTGGLGLEIESVERTNTTLRSEAFNNAYWTKSVTPTTDYANSPADSGTAERFQFSATSGFGQSAVYVIGGCPTGVAAVQSVFIRGTNDAGVTDLCGGSLTQCVDCAFVPDSWTRCTNTMTTSLSPGYFLVGNASAWNGSIPRAAADVLLWGAQCEEGEYVSSYIPTTSSPVVRTPDVPDFEVTVSTTSGFCSSATLVVPSISSFGVGTGLYAPALSSSAGISAPYILPYTVGTGTQLSVDGTGSSDAPTSYSSSFDASVSSRYIVSHDGTSWRICKDSSCSTNSTPSPWFSPSYSHIRLSTASSGSAVWKKLKIDPTYTECDP